MTPSVTPDPVDQATRPAAGFFLFSGGLALVLSLAAGPTLAALGALDVVLGLLILRIPWRSLPARAPFAILPLALGVVVLFQLAGVQTPASFAAFFFVVFVLAGVGHPPGTALRLMPFAAAAYVLPLLYTHSPVEDMVAVLVVLPLCVALGEMLARMERSRDRALAGVQEHAAALEAEALARKGAERDARQLADIVESSSDSIVAWGLNGQIISWNAGAERLYGYSAEEAVGQPLTLIVPDTQTGEVREIVSRISGGESIRAYETTRRTRDGRTIEVSLAISPILDRQHRVTGVSAIARDITEQKRAAEQLRRAQQLEAVGKLAGGLAHEFNNLLTVIAGNALLIRASLPDTDPLAADVDEIIQASERAAEVTRHLLAVGQRQILTPTRVDLNGVVRGAADFLRRELGAGITVETRLAPQGALALVDAGQVEQALLALAFRARERMPSGGVLTLETAPADESAGAALAALRVSDTGPRLEEGDATLFEAALPGREGAHPIGLRLSVVQGIVAQSGGRMQLRDAPRTVEILLPAAGEARSAAAAETRSAGDAAILLVDDDEGVRRLARRVLNAAGYDVVEAADGVAGLERWDERVEDISLVITDLEMPRMGGVEMARRIRTAAPGTRVVFISGYTSDPQAREGLGSAGAIFLAKPFAPEALLGVVREQLGAAEEPYR